MHLLIKDGVVANIIESPEGNWSPPPGFELLEGVGNKGDLWDGTRCVPASQAPRSAEQLAAYAAARRYAIETGGITLPNGSQISTDRDSQALITGAWNYVQNSGATSVSFKTVSGFVTMDTATLKTVALAVGDHVQKCFAAEGSIDAGIAAETITTMAEVDAAFVAIRQGSHES